MKCKIVKLNQFSGCGASIYTAIIDDSQKSLFDGFLVENLISYKSELLDIIARLKTIGNKTGARETYFKHKEGKPGDGVCALYDLPSKNLRLYCIRYGTNLLILGGGGFKPKHIKSLQDDPKLKKENYSLRDISAHITSRICNGDIKWSNDQMDLVGELEFNTDDYE